MEMPTRSCCSSARRRSTSSLVPSSTLSWAAASRCPSLIALQGQPHDGCLKLSMQQRQQLIPVIWSDNILMIPSSPFCSCKCRDMHIIALS